MTGFFDDALKAADLLEAELHVQDMYEDSRDAVLLVVRALREAIALNRGIMNENAGLKQRLERAGVAPELSNDDLFRELQRRGLIKISAT